MKFTFKTALAMAACVFLTLVSCSSDEPKGDGDNSDKTGGYGSLSGNLITIGSTRDISYTDCVLLGTVDFPKITSDHTYGVVYMEALQNPSFDYDGKLVYGGKSGKTDKEDYVCISAKITSSTADGKFEKQLVQLKPNTKYYYRAYVSIGQNVNYSEVEYFTTLDPTPEISMTTSDATDIFAVAGKMNGAVNVGKLQDVNEDQKYGFVYTDDARMSTPECLTYEYYNSWVVSHFETEDDMEKPSEVTTSTNLNGRINVDVRNLKPGATYYYRSFFKWNGKYFYSPVVKTLTTKGASDITVGTGSATEVTSTSAVLNATVPFSLIGLEQVRAGFMISKVYSSASEFNPEEAEEWSERYASPDADVYFVETETSEKDFSYYIEGLDPETNYYVCGYIYLGEYDDEDMWIKGSMQSFKTEASEVPGGDNPEMGVEVTTNGAYPWQQLSSSSWTNGNTGVHSSTSSLFVRVRHTPGQKLRVRVDVSSEGNCDGLRIVSGSEVLENISGTVGEREYELDLNNYTLENGECVSTIAFVYYKDGSVNSGEDRAIVYTSDLTLTDY